MSTATHTEPEHKLTPEAGSGGGHVAARFYFAVIGLTAMLLLAGQPAAHAATIAIDFEAQNLHSGFETATQFGEIDGYRFAYANDELGGPSSVFDSPAADVAYILFKAGSSADVFASDFDDNAVSSAILPLPASAWLFISGLVFLGTMRLRRRDAGSGSTILGS